MTHRLGRPLMLTALAGLASACAIDMGSDGMSDAQAVRENARLAAEQCGQGRIASVDADGFACKASGE